MSYLYPLRRLRRQLKFLAGRMSYYREYEKHRFQARLSLDNPMHSADFLTYWNPVFNFSILFVTSFGMDGFYWRQVSRIQTFAIIWLVNEFPVGNPDYWIWSLPFFLPLVLKFIWSFLEEETRVTALDRMFCILLYLAHYYLSYLLTIRNSLSVMSKILMTIVLLFSFFICLSFFSQRSFAFFGLFFFFSNYSK